VAGDHHRVADDEPAVRPRGEGAEAVGRGLRRERGAEEQRERGAREGAREGAPHRYFLTGVPPHPGIRNAPMRVE
jgi:hypothetical protein